jgi:hypothetical protein
VRDRPRSRRPKRSTRRSAGVTRARRVVPQASGRVGPTRLSASHASMSRGSNRTYFPTLWNGTRRSATRRRTNRSVVPSRVASSTTPINSGGEAVVVLEPTNRAPRLAPFLVIAQPPPRSASVSPAARFSAELTERCSSRDQVQPRLATRSRLQLPHSTYGPQSVGPVSELLGTRSSGSSARRFARSEVSNRRTHDLQLPLHTCTNGSAQAATDSRSAQQVPPECVPQSQP